MKLECAIYKNFKLIKTWTIKTYDIDELAISLPPKDLKRIYKSFETNLKQRNISYECYKKINGYMYLKFMYVTKNNDLMEVMYFLKSEK